MVGYIKIKGIRIYYDVIGKGPKLIFLHGYFLDSRCYREFICYLAKYFTVYIIDLPEHGRSGPVRQMNLDNMVGLLGKFIKRLDLKDPILFGHSAGALIAQAYAAKHSSKLIISSPPGKKCNIYAFIFKMFFLHPLISFLTNPLKSIPMCFFGLRNMIRNPRLSFLQLKVNLSEEHGFFDLKTILLWPRYDIFFPFIHSKYYRHSKLFPINSTHEWPVLSPKEINKNIGEIYEIVCRQGER